MRSSRKSLMAVRHVKCDESKPSCQKCVSTGRICDGYEFSARTPEPGMSRSDSGTLISSRGTQSTENQSVPSSLSSKTTWSERERRSFHFFCHTTAAQLSRFQEEDFWDKLILQASHVEPAIRHAIIALGSLHENFVNHNGLIFRHGPSHRLDSFALQQYNLAIKFLVEPFLQNERPGIDICLVACLLFASFEARAQSLRFAVGLGCS